MRFRVKVHLLVVQALCLVFLLGCSDESSLHRVSGTATFKGEPIPAGEIRFSPDTNQGLA